MPAVLSASGRGLPPHQAHGGRGLPVACQRSSCASYVLGSTTFATTQRCLPDLAVTGEPELLVG